MFELVFLTLMILFFLGNMLTIGVPFILMEWLDKRMAEWKSVAISSGTYLFLFISGIYLLVLIAPSIEKLPENVFGSILLGILFVWQCLPLLMVKFKN